MAKAKTTESANIFSTAATVKVEPKKAAADNKTKIEIKGLEDYAMVDSLEKNLKAIKETLAGQVKTQMKEIFTRQNNKRPENFRGIEKHASASCELRKRTIASVLTEEEVTALEADKVPVGTEVRHRAGLSSTRNMPRIRNCCKRSATRFAKCREFQRNSFSIKRKCLRKW